MFHPFLKRTYPSCPYVLNINNEKINNIDILLKSIKYEQINLSHDEFIETITNKCMFVNDYLDTIVQFINHITVDNENVQYYQLNQKISKNRKSMIINYHMTCYNDDIGTILNQNYESNILWCVIPLDGIVTSHIVKDIINDENKQTISSIFDNNYSKMCTNDKYRICQRKIIMRDIDHQSDKQINDYEERQYNNQHINKTIQLNDKTKNNLSHLRYQLLTSSKAQRLKKNPDLYNRAMKLNQYCQINNCLKQSSDNNVKLFDIFEYKHENVGIKKLNGIHTFVPINSGYVNIDNDSIDDKLVFISVMFNNGHLHLTIHNLTFIN